MKKILSIILSIAMLMIMPACEKVDNSWALRDGENILSLEQYLYYSLVSYENAVYYVDSDTKVLEGTIENVPTKEYIMNMVERYYTSYFWLERQIDELNISYTEQELDDAKYLTETQIASMGEYLAEYGISEEDFHEAYSMYNLKYQKVFESLYSDGGKFALSDEEFLDYYSQNYYSYEYIFAPLMSLNESNENVSLKDEEIEEIKLVFDAYLSLVEKGEKTLTECADDYMAKANLEAAPYNTFSSNIEVTNFPTGFLENLETMESGDTAVFESDGILVLMTKKDVLETAKNLDESAKLYSIMENKWYEYNSYVTNESDKILEEIEINEKLLKQVDLSDFVNDDNEYGYGYYE